MSRGQGRQKVEREEEEEIVDGKLRSGYGFPVTGSDSGGSTSSNGNLWSEGHFPVYIMGTLKSDSDSDVVVVPTPDLPADPIWDAMKIEAKLEAEKEPILSSFLYASILSHDCLERALGFVLANRLQNPTLLATQLMDIFDDVIMKDKGIQRSIRLDIQAFKERDPACTCYSWALLYFKGYHSLQSYRVTHALWKQGRRVLALALQSRISEVFAVDIHPAAKIGEGILLDHGTGVVIGETAVIGKKVSLMQGVTLGGTGKAVGDRHPKIGQGALLGAGATILGNIEVGEGAMIAAGSLVLKSVPPHRESSKSGRTHGRRRSIFDNETRCNQRGLQGLKKTKQEIKFTIVLIRKIGWLIGDLMSRIRYSFISFLLF